MKLSMRWLVGLAVCGCLAYASQALAGTMTYTDNGYGSYTEEYVFPSQTSVTTCAGQDTCPYDTSPPNITTVQVTWTPDPTTGENVLTSITLTSTTGGFMPWDSLFINSDYTGNTGDLESWNYYVINDADPTSAQLGLPGDGVYEVAGKYDYTYATTGRVGHANGIKSSSLTGTLYSGNIAKAGGTATSQTLTYDFSSLTTPIILGDNFAIGWTPYCANDVVLVAGTTGPSTLPEPTAMALFGLGMAGLASWRIRQAKNKE